ncbi:MAG: YggS family pyridoxal phosphate-dependent enzyme [Kiritimatiellia bacterium]|jgi:pyridoxal phosphate enzyme (YggS family)
MEAYDITSFEQRLDGIHDRIAAAAARAGRSPDDIQLVAVSKTFPPDVVDAAQRADVSVFGESRVQEALAKAAACGAAEWHFIGRLQRNKVRHALSLFTTIHSVDSLPLLHDIARIQDETGARPRLLLQVNVAGEASKIGFSPATVRSALREALDIGGIDIVGLMTLPPWVPDPELSRPHFQTLRTLRDALQDDVGISLPELSMGMSGDFEVAIEEGATFVRIGTALFGKRGSWKPQRSLDTDDFV